MDVGKPESNLKKNNTVISGLRIELVKAIEALIKTHNIETIS